MLCKRTIAVTLVLATALMIAGCPAAATDNSNPVTRLANAASGAGKIANGVMTTVTPAEVEAMAMTINEFNPEVPAISQAEAQVIINFLIANNINTVEDVENLDPATVEIPEGLEDLILHYTEI